MAAHGPRSRPIAIEPFPRSQALSLRTFCSSNLVVYCFRGAALVLVGSVLSSGLCDQFQVAGREEAWAYVGRWGRAAPPTPLGCGTGRRG